MPLYVTNGKLQLGEPGQLAAQRACCCNEEGDNPEGPEYCVCPDPCVFDVRVTAPISVRAVGDPCGGVTDVLSGTYDPFSECPGAPSTASIIPSRPFAIGGGSASLSGFLVRAGRLTTNSGTYDFANGVSPIETTTGYRIRCELAVYCTFVLNPEDQLTLVPETKAYVVLEAQSTEVFPRTSDAQFGLNTVGSFFYGRAAVFTIPGSCSRKSNLSCSGDSALIRAAYPSLPYTVTVTKTAVNGIDWQNGEFLNQFDLADGSQENVGCLDDVLGEFTATFVITQRQSCRIVDCNCSTSLDGLKATFQGVELTLGTSYDQTFPEDGYDRRITHGSSFGVYYFTQYEILPGNLFRDELNIELFCDTDEDADPPVSRWYARFISKCRVIDEFTNITAETTRTEIGYFVCGESAGCGGRASGDPIPLGEATEIEEEPGSPVTTDGLDACEPPTRASLSLSEDCG